MTFPLGNRNQVRVLLTLRTLMGCRNQTVIAMTLVPWKIETMSKFFHLLMTHAFGMYSRQIPLYGTCTLYNRNQVEIVPSSDDSCFWNLLQRENRTNFVCHQFRISNFRISNVDQMSFVLVMWKSYHIGLLLVLSLLPELRNLVLVQNH